MVCDKNGNSPSGSPSYGPAPQTMNGEETGTASVSISQEMKDAGLSAAQYGYIFGPSPTDPAADFLYALGAPGEPRPSASTATLPYPNAISLPTTSNPGYGYASNGLLLLKDANGNPVLDANGHTKTIHLNGGIVAQASATLMGYYKVVYQDNYGNVLTPPANDPMPDHLNLLLSTHVSSGANAYRRETTGSLFVTGTASDEFPGETVTAHADQDHPSDSPPGKGGFHLKRVPVVAKDASTGRAEVSMSGFVDLQADNGVPNSGSGYASPAFTLPLVTASVQRDYREVEIQTETLESSAGSFGIPFITNHKAWKENPNGTIYVDPITGQQVGVPEPNKRIGNTLQTDFALPWTSPSGGTANSSSWNMYYNAWVLPHPSSLDDFGNSIPDSNNTDNGDQYWWAESLHGEQYNSTLPDSMYGYQVSKLLVPYASPEIRGTDDNKIIIVPHDAQQADAIHLAYQWHFDGAIGAFDLTANLHEPIEYWQKNGAAKAINPNVYSNTVGDKWVHAGQTVNLSAPPDEVAVDYGPGLLTGSGVLTTAAAVVPFFAASNPYTAAVVGLLTVGGYALGVAGSAPPPQVRIEAVSGQLGSFADDSENMGSLMADVQTQLALNSAAQSGTQASVFMPGNARFYDPTQAQTIASSGDYAGWFNGNHGTPWMSAVEVELQWLQPCVADAYDSTGYTGPAYGSYTYPGATKYVYTWSFGTDQPHQ